MVERHESRTVCCKISFIRQFFYHISDFLHWTQRKPDTDKTEKEQLKLVKKVVEIVAADTPAESVRKIARLNREVNGFTRMKDETIPKYICRFVSRAQTHLNPVDAGVESAESQNFAMKLLGNAKTQGQKFSALIASIFSTTQTNKSNSTLEKLIPTDKEDKISMIIKDYIEGKNVTEYRSDELASYVE